MVVEDVSQGIVVAVDKFGKFRGWSQQQFGIREIEPEFIDVNGINATEGTENLGVWRR